VAKETRTPAARNYFLEPGSIFLADRSAVISTVLGSSVSVCLFDRKRNVGGMNHFSYPLTLKKEEATACYGNVATLALIRMMYQDGSEGAHLEAQIFGGAYNEKISSKDIGQENYQMARKLLARERIPVVSEDVGGKKGRKIVFNTGTNEIAVMKVENLRRSDWYPYEQDQR